MATPLNLELLAGQGFTLEDGLGPNDLVIAVRAADEAAADEAVEAVDRELAAKGDAVRAPIERPSARSLAAAARRDPAVSVAFLSIPGDHVAHEAAAALEAGLHVFCFSDGVSLEVEAALKRRALERELLFMGADCGTAIIDGVALGFANAVERGPVGIVGASGTGIQEVCCQLDAAGIGVSHAIGVGGRDLHRDVGGLMMRRGLELLDADADTQVIVAISKPPDPEAARAIQRRRRRSRDARDPRLRRAAGSARRPRGRGGRRRRREVRRDAEAGARCAARFAASTAAERCAARRSGSSATARSPTSGRTSTRRDARTR